MQVRKVRKDEFEKLISLMDLAFNMKDSGGFINLLPKLYYKDNSNMLHYGIYEDDKLVASVGLYTMDLISKYGKLKAGCIGAVSTHPDYRNKGYFTILLKKMIQVSKKKKYDLLFLGGNRYRYGHFGFENGGRKLILCLSKRTLKELNPQEYKVIKLERNNIDDIKACLSLYNKAPQRINRTVNNFYDHLLSWQCVPYVVKVNDEVVGYYCLKDENLIYEFIYKKGYKDTMLASCLLDNKEVYIQTSMALYNKDTLNKVDWFRVEHCEMFLVNNWVNVAKYLNFNDKYKDDFKKLSPKEKIRVALGNDAFNSKYGQDIFIFTNDQG